MAAPTRELSDESLEHAIKYINDEFGDNIDNLKNAQEIYDKFSSRKLSLETQLSFASSEAPSKIDSAVHDAVSVTSQISRFCVEQEELNGDIDNHLADVGTLVSKLSVLTTQIRELESYTKYLQCIGTIEDFSSDIQSALIVNSAERSVKQFAAMADLAKSIQSSKCTHLVKFANDTVVFWYKILKEKFSSEFEECLKAWKWPFIVSTVKMPLIVNASEQQEKLGTLFNYLLHLQVLDGFSGDGQACSPFLVSLPGWRPVLLPIQMMLNPLRKRFRYHFYGKKNTNSRDKPEWFFTQTLTWIRDHREFLTKRIQPLLEKAGLVYVDAVVEFSRGLVMLVMEKMLDDIPELKFDDHMYSHLIDEALSFERELREVYCYPSSQLSCLSAFTEQESFDKWIHIERKFASEKMDAMLSSPSAWESQYKDIADVDAVKLPGCGENFVTLMLTITERYKPLPGPAHKLKFLDLQLELLDDYRIRLLQVKNGESNNPLGQCYCAILNTVGYLIEVLKEWSELGIFLQLQYYKCQGSSSRYPQNSQATVNENISTIDDRSRSIHFSQSVLEPPTSPGAECEASDVFDESKLEGLEGTVFDDIIGLFEHMKTEMLTKVIRFALDDVKDRSRPYRKDRWAAMPSPKELFSLALSNSGCEMMLVLRDRLHQVQQLLSKPLFTLFWQKIADDLNTFFYTEVLLCNRFNEGGAAQIQFDMTRNLFPLFGQYTQRPENYFRDVKEACLLLTLNVGSALLLKDVLYSALHDPDTSSRFTVTDPVAALQDIGVYKLELEEAELVLSLRNNLTP